MACSEVRLDARSMTTATETTAADAGTPLRRNISILAVAQALFQSVQGMAIATTPLAALAILGQDTGLVSQPQFRWLGLAKDSQLATVPIFLAHLGLMSTTIPASMLMARLGRRAGFTVGGIAGVLSGVISLIGIFQQNFALMCLGAYFQGVAGAFAWYFRFAAADAADASYKAKAISLVMAGGVLAGFIGPQTAKWSVDLLSPVIYGGVYVMVALFSCLIVAVVQALDIPPLTAAQKAEGGRPLLTIMRQPTYLVALTSSMFGFAVMTLVMSATPLAMHACGFGFDHSATVIQAHAIAMFLPSFFTGHLINRFGVLRIIMAGAVIEVGCALVNLAGIDFWHFFFANILVGLGWNFCFVGGSTLLTETYRPAERAKAQGAHDFIVYGATASAALGSGLLAAGPGWAMVNIMALPLMVIVFCAAWWLGVYRRRGRVGAGGP
jgi:MFS family permease